MSTATPRAILAAGNVYMDRLDASGNPTGYRLEGSTADFKLTPENEEKELLSQGRDNYGEALSTVMVPGKTKVSMTLQTPSSESFAMAVLGTATADNQSSDTVSNEEVTVIEDYYCELANKQASSLTVSATSGGASLTLGTDYEVDLFSGLVKPLSTGALHGVSSMFVSYTAAAITAYTIHPNSDPSARFKIRLAGKNFADDKQVEVVCKKVALALSSDLNFGGTDFLTLELEGTCELPSGETHAVDFFFEE
jgi:hypothetical protein